MALNISILSNPSSDNCAICCYPLNNGNTVVMHEKNGKFHPLHKKCFQDSYIKVSPHCPFCKQPINFYSLFSRRDRLSEATKKIFAITLLNIIDTGAGGITACLA